jgi:hypothetical protein
MQPEASFDSFSVLHCLALSPSVLSPWSSMDMKERLCHRQTKEPTTGRVQLEWLAVAGSGHADQDRQTAQATPWAYQIKLYLSHEQNTTGIDRSYSEMLTYKPLTNNAVLRKVSGKQKK